MTIDITRDDAPPTTIPDNLPAIPPTEHDPPNTVVLSYEQVESLGRDLDELRARIVADLGQKDRDYLYSVIRAQRGFEIGGRALMYLGFFPPAWIAAVGALSVSKILDNMEIGHNVMHGQYDWMREDTYNSREFEWDTVCPADQWKHSHNYLHHTFTNIIGEDRDIGYGILRMARDQKWNPYYLGNLGYATALMLLFEWGGVMLHDLEAENVIQGKRKWNDIKGLVKGMWRKAGRQVLKDYVVFPALTGPLFVSTLVATPPPTWCATCGRTRSSSAVTSPPEHRLSPRRNARTRPAVSGTCGRCWVRPTSPEARCSTS